MLPGPILLTYGGLLIFYTGLPTILDISLEDIWVMVRCYSSHVSILDYLLQIWGVKKNGWRKDGNHRHINRNYHVGLFFTPLGILLGAFIRCIYWCTDVRPRKRGKHLKIAIGAIVGFIIWNLILKLVFFYT